MPRRHSCTQRPSPPSRRTVSLQRKPGPVVGSHGASSVVRKLVSLQSRWHVSGVQDLPFPTWASSPISDKHTTMPSGFGLGAGTSSAPWTLENIMRTLFTYQARFDRSTVAARLRFVGGGELWLERRGCGGVWKGGTRVGVKGNIES